MSMLRRFIGKLGRPKHRTLDSGEDDCARVFAEARAATHIRVADSVARNRVAMISPSCELVFLPAPLPQSVSEAQMVHARRLLPPEPRRSVAVIADTRASGSIAEINRTIPFVGILMALAYIGHGVIVFDGQLSRIEQGCRDCDVLIVDSGVLPHLHHDWYTTARKAMRSLGIYIHDRNTYALRPVLPNPKSSG